MDNAVLSSLYITFFIFYDITMTIDNTGIAKTKEEFIKVSLYSMIISMLELLKKQICNNCNILSINISPVFIRLHCHSFFYV